jgi:hypothetical protein
MKAYLFIETGEVRCPKSANWFLRGNTPELCFVSSMCEKLPILTRHEIDVPDGTDYLNIIPIPSGLEGSEHFKSIPIPRPKKKVEKWRCEGRLDGFKITTELITFDEAQMLSRYVDGLYRMEDTMIEVEE